MTVHIPILVESIVDALIEPLLSLPPDSPPNWIVDCTLGGGGHTHALLQAIANNPQISNHRVLALDRDPAAIEAGRVRFSSEILAGRLELSRAPFSELTRVLENRPLMGLMADLGFSSDQIEEGGRGLSFTRSGPLDMRLDPSNGVPLRALLTQVSEKDLADVIYEYGDERYSRKIAAGIVQARRNSALPTSTTELAELIWRSVPPNYRHTRIHPATRTFQALRIWVNDELTELDDLLGRGILLVKPGGRVAILSFHSLEDKRVKDVFKRKDSGFEQITKKPIEASEQEVLLNPRSRSAKLRIATKII
jgi:16S rRNA (cytosine1402-N4)-methyltransferase